MSSSRTTPSSAWIEITSTPTEPATTPAAGKESSARRQMKPILSCSRPRNRSRRSEIRCPGRGSSDHVLGMRYPLRRHRGFSGMDLLIISAVLLFAGGFVVLLAEKVDTTQNRVRCASNLRQIGQAILLYANENRGAFPRATYDSAKADKPTAYTNPKAELTEDEKTANVRPTFCAAGPAPNDLTAAVFLLILNHEISRGVFTCPTAHTNESPHP